MNFRLKILSFFILSFLTGCVSGADLTLVDQNSGKIATGTADRWDRTVTINLNGKTYSGQFTYVQRASPGASLTSEGVALSDGKIITQANDGSSLHCDFSFSGWSGSGTGECQDSHQRQYDLQLVARY